MKEGDNIMQVLLTYILGGFFLFLIVTTAVKIGVKEAIIELKKEGIL